MTPYAEFLASKVHRAPSSGVEVDDSAIHPSLFPFQRDVTRWALRKGRAAIFADTGLGKTRMQVEWARLTGERTLILAPLAVTQQTIREAEAIGVEVTYARHQGEADGLTITNYERLDRFEPSEFGAVVLDESSILKAYEGKTRTALIAAFSETPWRLACTATPAPNDVAELANHAEFLGVMSRVEMLAAFFIHDSDDGVWRLKGHARHPFWRWLASWSMTLGKPSDLGYEDDGYRLPPLDIRAHLLPTSYVPEGQLFAGALKGVTDRAGVRKATVKARVERAASLVAAEPDEQWLIWAGLNAEADALARAIPGSVNVQGSDDPDMKSEALLAFAAGKVRVLVTKPTVAGFGMNFQGCARMAFVGLGDSYEQYYQAIRRCWRFGQSRAVDVHIVLTEPEEVIHANVLRKEREATEMRAELIRHLARYEREEVMGIRRNDYQPDTPMAVPAWL
jgi:superfamily II DNA or RNA helicase